jgi:hypothetical protein
MTDRQTMLNPNVQMARALEYQRKLYDDRQTTQNANVQMASCRALEYQGKREKHDVRQRTQNPVWMASCKAFGN